jgi:hypothetical protein
MKVKDRGKMGNETYKTVTCFRFAWHLYLESIIYYLKSVKIFAYPIP